MYATCYSMAYIVAMFTEPGAVPKNAVPIVATDDIEGGSGGRYCRPVNLSTLRKRDVCMKCAAFKPERAHHCSICDRCVVKVLKYHLVPHLVL